MFNYPWLSFLIAPSPFALVREYYNKIKNILEKKDKKAF